MIHVTYIGPLYGLSYFTFQATEKYSTATYFEFPWCDYMIPGQAVATSLVHLHVLVVQMHLGLPPEGRFFSQVATKGRHSWSKHHQAVAINLVHLHVLVLHGVPPADGGGGPSFPGLPP